MRGAQSASVLLSGPPRGQGTSRLVNVLVLKDRPLWQEGCSTGRISRWNDHQPGWFLTALLFPIKLSCSEAVEFTLLAAGSLHFGAH